MCIEQLNPADISELIKFQPSDWPDIIPFFRFYHEASFCQPVKDVINKKIIGVGTVIYHKNTAWLAHIIVHPDYRCRGIGTDITRALITSAQSVGYRTILLIASEMGVPVYRKLGFETVTEYFIFRGGKMPKDLPARHKTIPFNDSYADRILALDYMASGEDRSKLIIPHLTSSLLFCHVNTLSGFYLPTLGEGLIVADRPEAGLVLLGMKNNTDRIVMPAGNKQAIGFLTDSGFSMSLKGTRMLLGAKINWQPEMIYSRIGGNLG
jgi:GNAT superfamily N-acetyltransferase